MDAIDLVNKAISPAINVYGDEYKALMGDSDFIPELTILESDDFNCGAVCN
mgnify:CR=1 FL=1